MARASRKERGSNGEVFVFDRHSIREVDRLAVEEFGIPSIVLMENAARHAADVALDLVKHADRPGVLVVAGAGNNGGDGLAIARHLSNAGLRVAVLLAGDEDKFRGDAATNLAIVHRMKLATEVASPGVTRELAGELLGSRGRPLPEVPAPRRGKAKRPVGDVPALVVDALFGTGLDREIGGIHAELIACMNELRAGGSRVLAVDIPSDLDAETGEPLGAAVRADTTVTFVGLKLGMCELKAQQYLGEVVVADIGAPRELTERLGTRLRLVPGPRPKASPKRAARAKSPKARGRGARG